MNYHLWTIGCQMNEADSRRLAEALRAAGHVACDDPRAADLIILNTCVVRRQAEDRARARLAELRAWKRQRPTLQIAVMGCLVGHRPAARERLAADLPFVDFFLPPSDPSSLLAALDAAAPSEGAGCARVSESPNAAVVSAHVPVVLGCSSFCAFCVIPYRRGPERSRSPADILQEVRSLAARGVREVTLLGQIVDRYGDDLPGRPHLADLLRAVAAADGIRRVRFLTNHPAHFDERLLAAIAETPAICPHFEIPAQAGDNEILRRMRRSYTVEDYIRKVELIRATLPECAVHSDFIVGFPGETAAQFEATRRLVETLRFDKIHTARYSPRPETYAARHYPDNVPDSEKERRRRTLDELQRSIQADLNARYLGKEVEVLVDAFDARHNRWRGRTRLDRLVFFSDARDRLGDLARIRIDWAGPYSLLGVAAD